MRERGTGERIRWSALVWAQGTRQECGRDVCQAAVPEGGTHQADNISPQRVWQQSEKCASRRCKLDMEEHTEKILQYFFLSLNTSVQWYETLWPQLLTGPTVWLLSSYQPPESGWISGPQIMDSLTWTKQHFENWRVFHIETPRARAGLVEKAATWAFSHELWRVTEAQGSHVCGPGAGLEYDRRPVCRNPPPPGTRVRRARRRCRWGRECSACCRGCAPRCCSPRPAPRRAPAAFPPAALRGAKKRGRETRVLRGRVPDTARDRPLCRIIWRFSRRGRRQVDQARPHRGLLFVGVPFCFAQWKENCLQADWWCPWLRPCQMTINLQDFSAEDVWRNCRHRYHGIQMTSPSVQDTLPISSHKTTVGFGGWDLYLLFY